jgi:hypothetical protein
MHEQVWVVMPTYNEAANIDGIIRPPSPSWNAWRPTVTRS